MVCDLLERAWLAAVEAEPQLQHLGAARVELREQLLDLIGHPEGVDRVVRLRIGERSRLTGDVDDRHVDLEGIEELARQRLVDHAPILANTATVFAAIWAAPMYATGMISNIGIEAVADHADSDPDQAASVRSSIDAVTNGLGGGNELVGGNWIGLVSIAALITPRLPRWLSVAGLATAVAGLATVVPAFEAVEMAFGLGSITWFIRHWCHPAARP